MSHSRKSQFTAIALGALATVGLLEGTRGVILPHFQADLTLTAAWAGAIFSAGALGSLATSLSFGSLSHRLGLKKMSALGIAVIAIAMATFLSLHVPVALYAAAAAFGAGSTLVELSTSIQISLIYQERQGGMLNLLHGFFGVGALLGAQWADMWVRRIGVGWRVPYGLGAVILASWAGYYLTLPETQLPREAGHDAGVGPLLKDPLVWVAAFALAAAVVGEAGSTLWLPSYLQKVKGLTEGVSAGYLTAFFLGFTGTRLAGGWLVNRFGSVRTVLVLALVGLGSMSTLVFGPGASIIAPVLNGVGVATGFATCTALVASRYPERVNQVYTVMYSAGGLVGLMTGPFMGWLGDRVGLGAAMWVPLTGYLVLAVLMGCYGVAARSGRREFIGKNECKQISR